MDTLENTGSVTRMGMSKNKKIGIGCGIAAIVLMCIAAALMCAGAGYFLYTLRDSAVLDVAVHHPETVRVGDSFELTVDITNTGETDIKVQSIDLGAAAWKKNDSILTGATVIRTEPDMDNLEISVMRFQSFAYDRVIKPGETNAVTFYFRAVEAGDFHTNIYIDTGDTYTAVWDIPTSIAP
jgi:hypothetical protein